MNSPRSDRRAFRCLGVVAGLRVFHLRPALHRADARAVAGVFCHGAEFVGLRPKNNREQKRPDTFASGRFEGC
jgi:hypothetical protein